MFKKRLVIVARIVIVAVAYLSCCSWIKLPEAGKYGAMYREIPRMTRAEFRSHCQVSDTGTLLAFILEENRYEFRSRVSGGEYILQGNPDIDYFEIAFYSDAKILMRERFYLNGTRIPEYSIGNWFRTRDDLDLFLKNAFGITFP